jgi:hypothetical protein
MRIINICIAVVVLIILLRIYQVITFGAPETRPRLNNIAYPKVVATIWRVFSHFLTAILFWIFVGITCIWLFWLFLKAISPITFFVTGTIARVAPPFKQLKRAGIFDLWSDVVKSLFQLSLTGLIRAFLNFFYKSGRYIAQTFVRKNTSGAQSRIVSNTRGEAPPPSPSPATIQEDYKGTNKEGGVASEELTPEEQQEQDAYRQANQEGRQLENEDATDSSMYSPQEHKAVETKMEMCVAENTVHEDKEASGKKKLQNNVDNVRAETVCKAMTVGEYGSMRKYKKPKGRKRK